jgi:hypothetical protein
MRFFLDTIFGILFIVGTVFIADSLATSEGAGGGASRQIVNWDVAGEKFHEFTETIRAGWNKLTR